MDKIKSNTLEKPVLVFVITDGIPDNKGEVVDAISRAKAAATKSKYGEFGIAFQFGQVGKDAKAQQWLGEIDTHPKVGNSIDCTSNFEMEQAEFMTKTRRDLTASLWLLKLMIGAVDPEMDQGDE